MAASTGIIWMTFSLFLAILTKPRFELSSCILALYMGTVASYSGYLYKDDALLPLTIEEEHLYSPNIILIKIRNIIKNKFDLNIIKFGKFYIDELY